MEKRFRLKRILAMLMAALVSVNSLPVTTFAEETDLAEENQEESVIGNEEVEDTETGENDEESVSEESEEEFDEFSTEEETEQSDEETVDSGTCGEELKWTLDNQGVLTISGTGKMTDYSCMSENLSPWYSKREQIFSVIIEEGATYIGIYAFLGLSNLNSIELPESMVATGYHVFDGCSALKEISIPSNVECIGDNAFIDCTSLRAINVSEKNENYNSKDGVLFDSEMTLIYCPGGADRTSYVIPDGVRTIEEHAFWDCVKLQEISIPNSVVCVKTCAFSGNNSLNAVIFKGNAPEFAEDSFLWVTATVYYPVNDLSWTEEIRQDYNGTLAWKAYEGELIIDSNKCGENLVWTLKSDGQLCIEGTGKMADYDPWENLSPWNSQRENIVSVVIGSGVTNIGEYAFNDCVNLTSVDISSSVRTIGDSAFQYCNSLISIDIPDSVTVIDDYAFLYCVNLESITLSNSILRMGDYVFSQCSNLKSINIPASVKEIGDGLFANCNDLGSINVEDGNEKYCSKEGTLFDIEMTKLIYCPAADRKEYNVPNSVRDICDYAFNGCSNLESIFISESVEKIGKEAFSNCTSLIRINLTNNITYMGQGTFEGCSSLTSIEIPQSLTNIGNRMFYDCTSLKNIKIPNDVMYIQSAAFRNCSSLIRMELPESITSIAEGAFGGCSNLRYINIPKAISRIENRTFDSCTNLDIDIPDNITYIGSNAFSNCMGLTNVTIPKSVTYIAGQAFSLCQGVKNITFIGNAPECGEDVFYGVTATAYYPANDPSWTEEVRQNYGGTIAWIESGSEIVKLVITDQPKNFTGNIGDTAIFTVGAEGDGVTYQWQYCNNGSTAWTNSKMTGADTDTLEVKVTKGRIGQKYRCVVKDSRENKLTSEEAQIIQEEKLTIVQQPESFTGNIGDTATFVIKAKGDGVAYQWQYCSSGSNSWKNSTAAGADTDTIEVKITKGRIGQKYRCIVKDSKENKLTSAAAQIIQTEKELTIIQQPENVTGNIGDTAVFTIGAEGDGVTYQWQYCNNGSTAWTNSMMAGSDTETIEVKITKGRIGQKYRCIVKDSKGKKLTSAAVQIIQAEKEFTIIQQPEDVVGKVGDTATFTIKAEGDGVTYQWQYCNNGSTSWTNSKMTGADTNTIEVKITKGRIGQKYRCIVKDSKGKKLTSDAAQIIQATK